MRRDLNTALARSLANETQVLNRDILVEAREVNAGGIPINHGARVQSQIDRMRVRGQITQVQYEAAQRLYKSYALGICQARDHDSGGSSAWCPSGYSDAVLNSARDYRLARHAVGRLWSLTWSVVIEDWSCERWRTERGIKEDPKGVMALFRHSLDLLVDHYAKRLRNID